MKNPFIEKIVDNLIPEMLECRALYGDPNLEPTGKEDARYNHAADCIEEAISLLRKIDEQPLNLNGNG